MGKGPLNFSGRSLDGVHERPGEPNPRARSKLRRPSARRTRGPWPCLPEAFVWSSDRSARSIIVRPPTFPPTSHFCFFPLTPGLDWVTRTRVPVLSLPDTRPGVVVVVTRAPRSAPCGCGALLVTRPGVATSVHPCTTDAPARAGLHLIPDDSEACARAGGIFFRRASLGTSS